MASKKGKADKKSTLTSDTEIAPVVPEIREIVKGRLNEQEWRVHLEEEENLEIVSEIVWDIVDSSWEIVYHNWVQREIYSYAVEDARKKLLQAISWNFLLCDEGEGDVESDPSWFPDEEPTRPPVDTWARGMVPILTADEEPIASRTSRGLASLPEHSSHSRSSTTKPSTQAHVQPKTSISPKELLNSSNAPRAYTVQT